MADFNKTQIDLFLGVVRKYMQVRGSLSQKDLADLTGIGESSLSRFMNKKVADIDSTMVAILVARLNIPLHEIIDFIEPDFEIKFKKMVQYYKDLEFADKPMDTAGTSDDVEEDATEFDEDDALANFDRALGGSGGTAKRNVTATINMGGKKRTIPFNEESNKQGTLRDKLEALSPRQRAYLTDFLNLDVEGRDLVVDLGNSLFRYFRQRGVEF